MKKCILYNIIFFTLLLIFSFFIKYAYAEDQDLSNLTENTSATVKIGDNYYTVNNNEDIDGLLELKAAIDKYRKEVEINSYEKVYEQTIDNLVNYAASISPDGITTIYYYNENFYEDKAHTIIHYKSDGSKYQKLEEIINSAEENLVVSLLTQYTVKTNESWEPSANIILFRGDSDGKRLIEINQNMTLTMKPQSTGSLTIDGYGKSIRTSYTPIRASKGSTINIYDNVVIKEFWCTTNGGVMYLDGGTINIYGGIFYHNTAGATGGFISCSEGYFNVYDGIFASNTSGSGGGVFTLKYKSNTGEVNFTGGVFVNNTTSKAGGAIHMTSGTLKMQNVVIYNNSATTEGGVIYLSSGNLELSNSLIYDNKATTSGGAIYMTGGNFVMQSGHIGLYQDDSGNVRKNKALNGSGGAIFVSGGNVTINDGYISSNEALVNGGGVYVNGGNVTVNNGNIQYNEAEAGGGMFITSTQELIINILGGNIKNNVVLTSGGGIGINITSDSSSTLNIGGASLEEISETTLNIANNKAPTNGGGMSIQGNVIVNIYNGAIDANETEGIGGGINIANDGEVKVYGGIISNNLSYEHGAGVNIGSNGKFTMTGGEIKYNTSTIGDGGGVYLDSGTYNMENGSINNNKAISGAGAYVSSATFSLKGGEFKNNQASQKGGGFYIGDGSTVNLTDGNVNNNKAINGGGFYQTQSTNNTITNISGNCIINANEATNGNGGGVYIDGGSTFRLIGGKIIYNKATNTAKLDGTKALNSSSGVGGGVYILKGTFTMYDENNNPGTAAIYGNISDYAADDLFATGKDTYFDAISVINMIKADEYKASDSWFEDFPLNEEHPTLNYEHKNDNDLSNDTVISKGRYKNILDNEDKTIATTVLYRNCEDYIAITMGNSVGKIKLSIKDENVLSSHSFIYNIESCLDENCNDVNPEITLSAVVQKGKDVIITNLPSGLYKVSIIPDWSWRYDENIKYEITENSITKDVIESTSVHINVLSEQYTDIFTYYTINNKNWLSTTYIK